MMMLRYILKELTNQKRFVVLFTINLSLGLSAFVTLQGFKTSLQQAIDVKSKTILGADLSLTSRRPIEELDIEKVKTIIDKEVRISQTLETFSMIANANGEARLLQIKVIENNFPFYGTISLQKNKTINPQTHTALSEGKVWVYPEVLHQLNVDIGDLLKIGDATFEIADVIKEDPSTGINSSFAPRIYMDFQNLEKTNLIRKGSLAWHTVLFELPTTPLASLKDIQKQSFQAITSPGVSVYTHQDAGQQSGRLLDYLTDFLGLASMVALFLVAIGLSFLYRSYFQTKIKSMAIYISLGLSRLHVFGLYLFQIFILGLLGSMLAIAMTYIWVPILIKLTQGLIAFDLNFTLSWSLVFYGLTLGALLSVFVSLPIFAQHKTISASLLLQNQTTSQKNKLWTVFMGINVILFCVISMVISNSVFVGGIFFGLFSLAILILGAMSWYFFRLLNHFHRHDSLSLKWALLDLSRNKWVSVTSFISIGLGLTLINLIPQLQNSLDAQLQMPEKSKVPSLFLFDIQENQINELENIVSQSNEVLSKPSPMIQGRLTHVNGQPFEKGSDTTLTREQEREMRFRNRGLNLSYRDKLSESEKIVKGKPFDPQAEKIQVSLEKRFADRLNLKLNDELTFLIESVPIVAEVVNLRSVQWTSFEPNFFILFPPGVLERAPKTFLAAIGSLTNEKKALLQNEIVKALPNVSMVDVSKIVVQTKSIMNQMAWGLQWMAFICIIAGIMVLFSIANHHAQSRQKDIGLWKALGTPFEVIRKVFLWQFGLIAFFAGLGGVLVSVGIGYVLSYVFFDGVFVFSIWLPLTSWGTSVVMVLFVTDLAIKNALKVSTIELFSK